MFIIQIPTVLQCEIDLKDSNGTMSPLYYLEIHVSANEHPPTIIRTKQNISIKDLTLVSTTFFGNLSGMGNQVKDAV